MTFRPYYAYMRARYNKNKTNIEIEVEKCYADAPDVWSEKAKEALKAKGISF